MSDYDKNGRFRGVGARGGCFGAGFELYLGVRFFMLKKFVLGGMVVMAALLGNACGDDGSSDSPAGPADSEVTLSSSSDDVVPGNGSSSSVTESPSTGSGQAPQSAMSDRFSSSEGAAGSSSLDVVAGSSSSEKSSSSMAESSSSVESSSSEEPSSSSVLESSSSVAESSSSIEDDVSSSSEYYKLSWDYLNPSIPYDTIIDSRDGQVYKIVAVGDKTWMAENLNYAYNERKTSSDLASYCYDNDPKNCEIYGRLYTWAAAVDSLGIFSSDGEGCGYKSMKDCRNKGRIRGICPAGWHLPDSSEWGEFLQTYAASIKHNKTNSVYSDACESLKSGNLWGNGGSNASGFSVLPAGYLNGPSFYYILSGTYKNLSYDAHFWTSSETLINDEDYVAYHVYMYFNHNTATIVTQNEDFGYAIRCLKDKQ